MTTTEQREKVDALVDAGAWSGIGEAIRDLVDIGITYSAIGANLRADVMRLASDAGVTESEALVTMLDFAVRESRRRLERDRRIATLAAESFARDGIPFDGLAVGTADVTVEG